MVREASKSRSIRLTDTVMKEMNDIIEEDELRSFNSLMELLLAAYKENKTTAFKKQKNSSDQIKKDINILKKDLSALLYLNGTMAEFFSISDIDKVIEDNGLIIQAREGVKRDIEKNQVKKSYRNN
ncbi:MAG: hypothetical protein KC455_08815 [Carnobacterium sp.]|nr:hypothetical protein [Carnobacterium sp.]